MKRAPLNLDDVYRVSASSIHEHSRCSTENIRGL
jgi:hypothetical protein